MHKECLKILQSKEYEMLKEIDSLFSKYNVCYYLACGTLLGAIRHKGFIPWDDDVDIYINGCDYDKAKEIIVKHSLNLEWHDFETQEGYPYTFPKIVLKNTVLVERSLAHSNYKCGVYIDVFPLSNTSDSSFSRFFKERLRHYRYSLIRLYYNDFDSPFRKFAKRIVSPLLKVSRIQKKLKYSYTKKEKGTKYLIDVGTFGKQALLQKKSFLSTKRSIFVGQEFNIPFDYDLYLKDYYGDYLELPKEEDRITKHNVLELFVDGRKII